MARTRAAPGDLAAWIALAQAVARTPGVPVGPQAGVPFVALARHPELVAAARVLAGLQELPEAGRVRHVATGLVLRWLPPRQLGGAAVGGVYLAESPLTRGQARALGLAPRLLADEAPEDGERVAAGLDPASVGGAAASAGLRLPTEAEHELAATGGDDRPYPWGTEPGLGAAEDEPAYRRREPLPDLRDLWPRAGTWPRLAGPFGHQMLAGPLLEPCQDAAGDLSGYRGSAALWTRRARCRARLGPEHPAADRAWVGARLATGAPPRGDGPWPREDEAPPPPRLFRSLAWPTAWPADGLGQGAGRGPSVALVGGSTLGPRLTGYPAHLVTHDEVPGDHLFLLPGCQPMLATVHLAGEVGGAAAPGTRTFESLDELLRASGPGVEAHDEEPLHEAQ